MTKDIRAELAASRENAEGLLKSSVDELRKLLQAPKSDTLKWFPHGIDGVKVSVKLAGIEVTFELEGVQPAQSGDDES